MRARFLLQILAIVAICGFAQSAIHNLDVEEDDRKWFLIESFGFLYGGTLNITVNEFATNPPGQPGIDLIVAVTQTDSSAFDPCETKGETVLTYKLSDLSGIKSWPLVITRTISPSNEPNTLHQEGLYSIYFRNCQPVSGQDDPAEVTMDMHLELYNAGPDYLSAGQSSLPILFFVFTCIHVALFVGWLITLLRHKTERRRLHWLMAVLVLFKFLSLLFEGLKYHSVQQTGHAVGLTVVYYIFTFAKTMMRISILLLLGAGWSVLKPLLSDREKKIFIFVLPLQLGANIAVVVINEMLPGSQGWVTWSDLFYLLDILCCIAIMLPIVWSIKYLREASGSDGKAAKSLRNLTLFRQFYVIVISYIYFTRIVVFLLQSLLPFRLTYMGNVFEEVATTAFFVITGYLFRPVAENPYLRVETEDLDDLESAQGAAATPATAASDSPVAGVIVSRATDVPLADMKDKKQQD